MTPEPEPTELPIELVRFATLPKDRQELMLHISGLLDQLAYGTVVVVVQDRRVIQVEISEKIRLK